MTETLPPVAILAGGLATRMRPHTETVPKALLDVAGEPFIAHQLRLLRREGIDRVVLCLGYLGEQVEAFVGDGSRFGLDVRYAYDGPALLGTGGALRRALPLLGECFFVLYGDSYLDIPLREIWDSFKAAGQPALMTVFRNEGRWDTSNVVYDGRRVLCYSKRERQPDMAYIDYGLGLLSADLFADRPADQAFDLAELHTALASSGRLAGWAARQRFYEIGTPAGLAETDQHLRTKLMTSSYTGEFLDDVGAIARSLDHGKIDRMIEILAALRQGKGRLFILGVGGSAGNAGHAVNDFRKICGIEAYAPTDNVSELTARANDEGWPSIFVEWLKISRLTAEDVVMVFSVGGGDLERNVSPNLVVALKYAKEVGAKVVGVVGRNGGYTAQVADAAIIIPTVHPERITPHSEAFQAVVWHLIVSHPAMKAVQTKWESVR